MHSFTNNGSPAPRPSVRCLNRDLIKYIAAAAMLCNHAAHVFAAPGTVLYTVLTDIGYFTAITMCYFLVEGYSFTRSKERYALRLLVFALFSQPFYQYALGLRNLNMLFSLLLCFLLIHCQETMAAGGPRAAVSALLFFCSFFCDWGGYAPLFVLLFLRARGSHRLLRRAYATAYVMFVIGAIAESAQLSPLPAALFEGLASGAGLLASGAVILHLYSGKRAAHLRSFSKWFFYLFYPAHLAVLAVLRLLLRP